MRIGVFDSGIGGLSVAHAIEEAMPQHEIVFMNDQQHVPYGDKTPAEVLRYMRPIIDSLVIQGCRVIVIACNTATTTLIDKLRAEYNVPFVAVEPMVKPAAALTKRKVIAVCATPATLTSPRYKWLKDTYAKGIKVLEPDCSDWALMIERSDVDEQKIAVRIENVIGDGADVIVLGCTHYHWIEKEIQTMARGRAKVLQPEVPLIRQLSRVIDSLEKKGKA